jgi:hypothetical protein
MAHRERPLEALLDFPLMDALFGRRARRFGMGMELPSGPLAYRSEREPLPLTETEQMVLVAAATGVTGWSFGVPFGPRTPGSHAEFTLRFGGRPAPTAAGLGTPILFFTDDDGCYCTRTRDLRPAAMNAASEGADAFEAVVEACRRSTRKIRDGRLDLPSTPPHVLPPNLWWANRSGSTLFMPVGDASEECLGLLALMARHGVTVVDQDTGEPAGELDPFFRSGILDPEKRLPLSELQSLISESLCLELGFMGHNITLALQAIGLGGLFFNGLDDMSVLGAHADAGIEGLGFRFTRSEAWVTPNAVGIEGVYEGLCPPFCADMSEAVDTFVRRKFGPDGAYDVDTPGPWKDSAGVKGSVAPYDPDFVACISTMAQYIQDKHGKFPGTRTTMMLPGYVQAHHLDTDFYDKNYRDGAYLSTHAEHLERWHGGGDNGTG